VLVAAALSPAQSMAGCQSGSTANNTTTFLLNNTNCQGNAPYGGAIAVGDGATASGVQATAMGRGAYVNSGGGTAFGSFAAAKGVGATAVGHLAATNNPAVVDGATSIGARSNYNVAGIYSTAIGAGPPVVGDPAAYFIAPHSQGSYSIAIGGGDGAVSGTSEFRGALSPGFGSTAIGVSSKATNAGAAAYGSFSTASGFTSVALGDLSVASGDESLAFGPGSAASAESAVALGSGARAARRNAVAIGAGSVANANNVVSLGSNGIKRRIVNVANGVNPNDAVTVAQLQAALSAATATVQRLEARIAQIEGRSVAAAPAR
jgi:autotransporter adhesin